MIPLNPDLLRSGEQSHVRIVKIVAWRNLLYAHGIGESLIQDSIQEQGDGMLPSSVEELMAVPYITLEAVEAVLIDLLANVLNMKD